MPAGASAKREREYQALKREFKKEGRYKGREDEVASRIVNKQRKQFGETRRQKVQEQAGDAPDKNLPLPRYRHLTIPGIRSKLHSLSQNEIRQLREYEQAHKKRKTLLALYARSLND